MGQGIFRSTDNGESWTEVNNGLSDYSVNTIKANSIGYLFAGSVYGAHRSTDNGENWEMIINGLSYRAVFDLAINPAGYIFAATQNGVYRSTDNGDSWNRTNSGITASYVNDIIVNINGDVFAGSQGNNGGVFRSTNNGENWTQVNSGLTELSIRELTNNSLGDIFTSTNQNLFRSTNNGNEWTEFSSGITSFSIQSITASANGIIYAGSFGGGVYKTIEPVTHIYNDRNFFDQNCFSLGQNYPNPFNPSTKINYSVLQTSFVTIRVYDLLGNEIATLVNEAKQVGNYVVGFDGSELSSGIYFYKMQAGNFVDVKKLIMIK